MLKEGEKIYVKRWSAETFEDDPEKGESTQMSSSWADRDYGFSRSTPFDTAKAALEDVCRLNGFGFRGEDWIRDETYADTLHGSFTVDEGNCEASAEDVRDWKAGKKRLWACRLRVELAVRTERDPEDDELDLG